MNIIVHSYCYEKRTADLSCGGKERRDSKQLIIVAPPSHPSNTHPAHRQTSCCRAAPISPGAPRIFCSPGRRRREMTSSGPRWWKTDRPLGPRLPSTGRPTPTHNRHGAEEALWRGDDQESATRLRSCFTVTIDDYYIKIHDKIDTACWYLPRF